MDREGVTVARHGPVTVVTTATYACLRSDRLSAIEQWGLDEAAAGANEARRGREVIATGETVAGTHRFAAGAGRKGAPVPDASAGPAR